MRNRIISGLSDVLIVIEAAKKSGTAITVGYALDQGKEVFALPGRIDDPLGYGCNRFIKEGANIITESKDILDYFGIGDEEENDTALVTADMGENERKVYEVLGMEPMHIEKISANAGLDIADTLTALAELESEGLINSPRRAFFSR